VERGIEAARVVVEPEERGQAVEHPIRAGTPCLGLDAPAAELDEERRGPVKCAGDPGGGGRRDPERGVAPAAAVGAEDELEVGRGLEDDRPAGHGRLTGGPAA